MSYQEPVSRRKFLDTSKSLLGTAAFASLLQREGRAAPLAGLPHFAPKAKRVIYLFQAGGPSHIDMFDYHPALRDLHGTELPDSVRQGQRITGMTSGQKSFPCVAPMFEFEKVGERQTWMNTEILPHTAAIADKLTVIRSMNTEAISTASARFWSSSISFTLGKGVSQSSTFQQIQSIATPSPV